MDDKKTTFPRFIWIIVALFLLLIVYWTALSITRAGKTKVSIIVIPQDANVTLDNKPVSSGDLYLAPGDYTFSASKNGFKTDTHSVKVGKESLTVGLLPEPESTEAKKWLSDNSELQLQREELGGINANREGDELVEKNPILDALPYKDIYGPFNVDYGASDRQKGGILLDINGSTPPGRAKAIEWIRQQGQDPTDLEIRYSDFKNPLINGDVQECCH